MTCILVINEIVKAINEIHVKKVVNNLYFYGLIKFLVPVNIYSFVFSPYKIKSHFLIPVPFSLSILGTKSVDGNFLQ